MKSILKRHAIVSALAGIAFAGLAFQPGEAKAGRTVQQGFDRSQCSNGMCTVLRVLVELNSSNDKPIVRISKHDFDTGATTYSYDTVVQRADDACSKDVVVPQDVFNAISAVFRSISADGTPPPVLTPTQQTLLLFYTTLLQQTQGFECTPRDLGEVDIPTPPVPPAQPTPQPGQTPGTQPYPGQPYPGQPYPGQPYPGQPYPGQPYPGAQPGQPQPGAPVFVPPIHGGNGPFPPAPLYPYVPGVGGVIYQ